MFYVYRYINHENQIIYIGLTEVDIKSRLDHKRRIKVNWYGEISRVEYTELPTPQEMTFCEFYLISKNKPKYNKKDIQRNIGYTIDYFDNLKWLPWDRESHMENFKNERSLRQSKINYALWGDKEYKSKRVENMARKPYRLVFADGTSMDFKSRFDLESYFIDELNMSVKISSTLIKTKAPYKTHYSKYKHLLGMYIEEIKED